MEKIYGSLTCCLSSQEEELSKLLDAWNFGYMPEKLQSEEVTLTRLRFLIESDLDLLFRNGKIGEKAEFRLLEWKKEKSCFDTVSFTTYTSPYSKNLGFKESERSIASVEFDSQSVLNEHHTSD